MVASINEYKTTLNPALDHSFLERLKKKQLDEQQAVQAFVAEEQKAQAAAKSKEQKRIDALMQKEKLSNHETFEAE